MNEVLQAFDKASQIKGKPSAIVARTIKGYPIHVLLPKDPNHHGKPLTKEEAEKALAMLA
jgi:transketolase